jgi:hypothetical protein
MALTRARSRTDQGQGVDALDQHALDPMTPTDLRATYYCGIDRNNVVTTRFKVQGNIHGSCTLRESAPVVTVWRPGEEFV